MDLLADTIELFLILITSLSVDYSLNLPSQYNSFTRWSGVLQVLAQIQWM